MSLSLLKLIKRWRRTWKTAYRSIQLSIISDRKTRRWQIDVPSSRLSIRKAARGPRTSTSSSKSARHKTTCLKRKSMSFRSKLIELSTAQMTLIIRCWINQRCQSINKWSAIWRIGFRGWKARIRCWDLRRTTVSTLNFSNMNRPCKRNNSRMSGWLRPTRDLKDKLINFLRKKRPWLHSSFRLITRAIANY